VHLLTEVLVKDEAQYVVTEVISSHLTTQGIGNVPELLFELLFVVVGHVFPFINYIFSRIKKAGLQNVYHSCILAYIKRNYSLPIILYVPVHLSPKGVPSISEQWLCSCGYQMFIFLLSNVQKYMIIWNKSSSISEVSEVLYNLSAFGRFDSKTVRY